MRLLRESVVGFGGSHVELLRTGRMNAQGRFREGSDGTFRVHDSGVFFTESDVNELAQAKGANVAGLRIVADVFGIELEDVDRFTRGRLRSTSDPLRQTHWTDPNDPGRKNRRVGNAALEGASRVLLSQTHRPLTGSARTKRRTHRAETHEKSLTSSWKDVIRADRDRGASMMIEEREYARLSAIPGHSPEGDVRGRAAEAAAWV